ncbi:PcfJ domain-containing protein [Ralstonia sp. ASV6]|uniref:PcfJ domain-containing protein n=1 Tax=Ralstonia sp. ASV6 TaxID=2795124 RepID=UPI0018EDE1B4|nr:PcfJ domain-containing protein [Ralstonia sp. ASV6]
MERGEEGFLSPGVEASVSPAMALAPVLRGRKNLFGREDLADVYRRAKQMIVDHKVFRLVQVSEAVDGGKSVIICNLWRVDRSPEGAVQTLEFDLKEKLWKEVDDLGYWPRVPFFPIQKTQKLDWWRDITRKAIWAALVAAGYKDLPWHLSNWDADWDPLSGTNTPKADAPKPDMSPGTMASILLGKYLGKGTGIRNDGKENWKDGLLTTESMLAGARALRAAIFDHVLDAEVLSAMLAIEYDVVWFHDYLRHAKNRDALLKVSKERRNLLPLLRDIRVDQWSRDDLFSRKLWVRDGRKRTLVEYPRFNASGNRFVPLESRAAMRWLFKSKLTVIRKWASVNGGGKDPVVVENLARANITVDIPAIAWWHLVTRSYSVRQLGVSDPVQRLYRAFAIHCAAMWKEQGFAHLKNWLQSGQANLGDIADWLRVEGIDQGFPDRHATWSSLVRRSRDWHMRTAEVRVSQTGRNHTWTSLVPEIEIEGIRFTPLNSVRDLMEEGRVQRHCVADYADDCIDGEYRVYRVVEPDGTRSTLGLWRNDRGHWEVEQHRGMFNDPVSATASEAGEKLMNLYRVAQMQKRGKTAAPMTGAASAA